MNIWHIFFEDFFFLCKMDCIVVLSPASSLISPSLIKIHMNSGTYLRPNQIRISRDRAKNFCFFKQNFNNLQKCFQMEKMSIVILYIESFKLYITLSLMKQF